MGCGASASDALSLFSVSCLCLACDLLCTFGWELLRLAKATFRSVGLFL